MNEEVQKLRDKLCKLYPDENKAWLVANDIDLKQRPLANNLEVFWDFLLSQVADRDLWISLKERIARNDPNPNPNSEYKAAVELIDKIIILKPPPEPSPKLALVHPADSPKTVSRPIASQQQQIAYFGGALGIGGVIISVVLYVIRAPAPPVQTATPVPTVMPMPVACDAPQEIGAKLSETVVVTPLLPFTMVVGGKVIIHVAITNSFEIDKYQVTNQRYLDYVKSKGITNTETPVGWTSLLDGPKSLSDYPKPVFVSWIAANAYCEAQGKELPDERYWELACRDDLGVVNTSGLLEDTKNSSMCENITNVGVFSPSRKGIHDMLGKVKEWTKYPPTDKFPPNNSVMTDPNRRFIVRGASSGLTGPSCIKRELYPPQDPVAGSSGYVGFRCIKL